MAIFQLYLYISEVDIIEARRSDFRLIVSEDFNSKYGYNLNNLDSEALLVLYDNTISEWSTHEEQKLDHFVRYNIAIQDLCDINLKRVNWANYW